MKLNFICLFFITLIVTTFSLGCLAEKQYGSLEYSVSIETDRDTLLYVPLMLDLPNQTVSDLINLIKVENDKQKLNVSYNVIDATYGKALSIRTSKSVTLKATLPYKEYLQSNQPILIDPANMHFDFSMKKNSSYYEGRGIESYHWIYFESSDGNATQRVKVKLDQKITTSGGVEYWTTYEDNTTNYGYSTLRPGWQFIRIESGVAVY